MTTRSSPLAAALAAILGCAAGSETLLPLTPVPAEPPPDAFAATGEILAYARSAGFTDWRVVGQAVNMTRADDGSWKGDLLGRSYMLKPGEGKVSGAGANIFFVRSGREILVRGYLQNQKFSIRILPGEGLATARGIACRFDGNLIDCEKKSASERQGIEFRGQAALVAEPPLPQFALALIAAAAPALGLGP
jgi:hypothetical protein